MTREEKYAEAFALLKRANEILDYIEQQLETSEDDTDSSDNTEN